MGQNEETYGEDPYLTGELGIQFVKGMQGDDPRYLKTIATVKHFVANNVEKERRGGTSVMNESTLRDYYAEVFRRVVEGADPASQWAPITPPLCTETASCCMTTFRQTPTPI